MLRQTGMLDSCARRFTASSWIPGGDGEATVDAANVKAPPVAGSRERPSSAAAATEPSTSSSSSVKASHDPRLIKTTRKGMKFQREVQAQLREARTVRRCRLNTTG